MRPDFLETDTFSFERELIHQGYAMVAGTDEAGRGPLAGPVVAASVILPGDCDFQKYKDSKKLSPTARCRLYGELKNSDAMIGVGICSVDEITQLNILRASLLAMKKAVKKLPTFPDFLLVDGKFTVPLSLSQEPLIKGESRSASIAAASIVAKEVRDEIMAGYHAQFPEYNFLQHKGYPTAEHRQLIAEHGPCEIHRPSFKGVREYVGRIF